METEYAGKSNVIGVRLVERLDDQVMMARKLGDRLEQLIDRVTGPKPVGLEQSDKAAPEPQPNLIYTSQKMENQLGRLYELVTTLEETV